ncbi:MAG: hypothetical protein HC772_19140 [Leptolyngbyaceae cyanobacterium CRU_2_3]|nr:hypothetical protein [Leptolyngbyaceae cyanobacterium CRU_2_3]
MTDEEDKIQAANAQLSRVKLSLRGKKLYVKGTLPPKPGEYKARQREIPTNCNASPSQIKIALALAKKN